LRLFTRGGGVSSFWISPIAAAATEAPSGQRGERFDKWTGDHDKWTGRPGLADTGALWLCLRQAAPMNMPAAPLLVTEGRGVCRACGRRVYLLRWDSVASVQQAHVAPPVESLGLPGIEAGSDGNERVSKKSQGTPHVPRPWVFDPRSNGSRRAPSRGLRGQVGTGGPHAHEDFREALSCSPDFVPATAKGPPWAFPVSWPPPGVTASVFSRGHARPR
jgi:hypothetical protein